MEKFGSQRLLGVMVLSLSAGSCSCDGSKREQSVERVAPAPEQGAVAPRTTIASALSRESEEEATFQEPASVEQVLSAWNDALNRRNFDALEQMYADEVWFYGKRTTRKDVLANKRVALESLKSFQQEILGDPVSHTVGDTVVLRFRKRSGAKGKQNDVAAKLTLARNKPWRILREEDEVSEKRFGSGYVEERVPTDCSDAVWMIVDSTARARSLYRRIKENLEAFPPEANLRPGGMGPFTPDETGDGTYDLSIGVHHPERFEAYAWFTVTVEGKVTVSSMYENLLEHPETPSRAALKHFKRLCQSNAVSE